MLFALLFMATLAGSRVDIRESDPRFVLNEGELRRLCAAKQWRTIYACTLFTEETLEGHCRERGGLWYPDLNARLAPVMLLSHPRYVPHEREHIDDIRLQLEAWISEETAVGYNSRPDCERRAQSHVRLFPGLMNSIRRASNERIR